MATSNELYGLDQFIVSRLSADTTLVSLLGGSKFFSELAPQATAFPYVLISFLAGTDVNVLGWDFRVMTRPVLAIRAVTSGNSFGTADAIADRIDAVLMGAKGTTDSGTLAVLGMVREELIRRVEVTPEGTRINYVGGRFRAYVCGV